MIRHYQVLQSPHVVVRAVAAAVDVASPPVQLCTDVGENETPSGVRLGRTGRRFATEVGGEPFEGGHRQATQIRMWSIHPPTCRRIPSRVKEMGGAGR